MRRILDREKNIKEGIKELRTAKKERRMEEQNTGKRKKRERRKERK